VVSNPNANFTFEVKEDDGNLLAAGTLPPLQEDGSLLSEFEVE
jgi:hypothetical protein